MNKGELLIELDDLRVATWEMRDLILKTAKNETWSVVHKAPALVSKYCVDTANMICDRYTEMLNRIEEDVYNGDVDDYQELADEMMAIAAANVLRFNNLYAKVEDYKTGFTDKAVFRKSYIRR